MKVLAKHFQINKVKVLIYLLIVGFVKYSFDEFCKGEIWVLYLEPVQNNKTITNSLYFQYFYRCKKKKKTQVKFKLIYM